MLNEIKIGFKVFGLVVGSMALGTILLMLLLLGGVLIDKFAIFIGLVH